MRRNLQRNIISKYQISINFFLFIYINKCIGVATWKFSSTFTETSTLNDTGGKHFQTHSSNGILKLDEDAVKVLC